MLVTDSGIGGLSVASMLYDKMRQINSFENVDIIYCDSRENKQYGYNAISDTNKRISVFSDRLKHMYKMFKPDIIFIACNTLSILYNKTDFYKKYNVPVIDIFNIGADIIFNYLKSSDENNVFILGTKTTINDNNYKNYLVNLGIEEARIINQMSPNLAKYIESSDINSDTLDENISWLVNRMIEKSKDLAGKFAVSLNCTHYIYVARKIKDEFLKHDVDVDIICPNIEMCNVLDKYLIKDRYVSDVNFYICNNFKYNINGLKRVKRTFDMNIFL